MEEIKREKREKLYFVFRVQQKNMKIESVERGIIFGCLFLLCLLAFHSLIYFSFLLPISKILIVEISLLLVLVCLMGFSVYHVQMWRDANSGSSLINNLYTITAIVMQVQSVLLCGQIFHNVFCPKNISLINYVTMLLWFSRVLNFFHMIVITIIYLYRQYKPSEYLNISVNPRGKWIILSLEFFLSLLFFLLQLWDGCFDKWTIKAACSVIARGVKIVGPILMIVCVLLLLKVTEDGYGILKRTKKSLSLLCPRNQNLVTPLNEELGNEQDELHPINDEQVGTNYLSLWKH